MGYNLTIDQGNSSAKVTVWDKVDVVYDASFATLGCDDVLGILKDYPLIDRAIYSSVANEGEEIINLLTSRKINTINLNSTTSLPITNAYKTPETLGKDRIAAAVGAWSRFKGSDILVIDLGTAITYDIVTEQGCYIGGNIAPGVTMRLEALHHYTRRLPLVDPHGDLPMWGTDTETAIRSGVVNGIIGEITHYKNKLSSSCKVVLTGGAAAAIKQLLDFPVEIDQHLVTRGLNSILIYNENN